MYKSKKLNIVLIALGVIIVFSGFLFGDGEYKKYGGVFIGVGSGLFAMCLSNICMINFEKKNPEITKHQKIESNDERRIIIRDKSKAMAGDITKWFIMGIAYIMIIIDAPLWATLITVLVYLLYHILSFYFMMKLEKEM